MFILGVGNSERGVRSEKPRGCDSTLLSLRTPSSPLLTVWPISRSLALDFVAENVLHDRVSRFFETELHISLLSERIVFFDVEPEANDRG